MKRTLFIVVAVVTFLAFGIKANALTEIQHYTKIEGQSILNTPYEKKYYVDGNLVLTINNSQNINVLNCENTSQTGFYKIEGETYYLNSGEVLRGLYNIGNKLYAFNAEGKMIKGFKKINNKMYYFSSDGSAIKGLVYIGKARYYFNNEYNAHIGYINLWGYTYYCGSDYLVKTNWQKINNKWYYFNQYGVMQKGFKTISKKMYYFNSVGVKTLGMVNHNGSYFYVYEGRTARNQFVTVSGYKYYFDHRTKAIKGWKTVGKKTYYFNSQYRMQKGFQTIGKKRYHFGNSSGELKKGWVKINNCWFYFSKKTGEVLPGFRKVSKQYVLFDSYGRKLSGKEKGTYILISIKNQNIKYYKNKRVVFASSMVSGHRGKWDTPRGVFRVFAKERNRYLTGADYKSFVSYWMPFSYEGVGLHDANWRSSFKKDRYIKSGSHGCINMPPKNAKKLYNMIPKGTIVIVQ